MDEFRRVCRAILNNTALRNILMITLGIVVLFPVLSNYFIFPRFVMLQTRMSATEAARSAEYLKRFVRVNRADSSADDLEIDASAFYDVKTDMHLEKIKVFSKTGETLFSTDPADVGVSNTHDYFHTTVAAGNSIWKKVTKNSVTLEGRKVSVEVIEVYVPIMSERTFSGAIEVYYDVSDSSTSLSALIDFFNLAILIFMMFFAGVVFIILYKSGRHILEKDKTDAQLLKAHALLEKKVAERTAELKSINQSLVHEIEIRKITEASLQHSYDTQTIVARLLKESMRDATITQIVEKCLDLVLSLPWLSFESMGSIFLVDEKPGEMVLKAQKGFSRELITACERLPFGRCLCGRAALTQKTVFADHIDGRHDIRFSDMADHGHYCIPILAQKETLGVINIYVKPGHQRNEWEEKFLTTISDTLAGILIQHRGKTEKKVIENRLNQSQKMEAIGTLAGGIAHDFNNILSGIFAYVQLAEVNLDQPEKVKKSIEQIDKGARRASELIQQILTFSRQTSYKKSPIKPYLIIKEAVQFLRSTIPSTIRIRDDVSTRSLIKADPTQIHQIIMNLCTNAYQAMQEEGGEMSVTLKDVRVPQDGTVPEKTIFPDLNLAPGSYLELEVCDSGPGMPPQILSKIFDPYFTTKDAGKGTGLGLAVVFGIVQEHGGYIKVFSEPGRGTCFYLWFPVLDDNMQERPQKADDEGILTGTEQVMIIDDEDSILSSSRELLTDYGYRVQAYPRADQAFEAFKKEPDTIDLIITDMTMPGMTGDVFAQKVLDLRRDLPIILCTGYSDRISKNKALKMGIARFLIKPVSGRELLTVIRNLLDGDKNNAPI